MKKIRSRAHRPKHIIYNVHIYTSNPTVYRPGRCCFHQDDIYNKLYTYNNIEKNVMYIQSSRLSSNALTTKTMKPIGHFSYIAEIFSPTYRYIGGHCGKVFFYVTWRTYPLCPRQLLHFKKKKNRSTRVFTSNIIISSSPFRCQTIVILNMPT